MKKLTALLFLLAFPAIFLAPAFAQTEERWIYVGRSDSGSVIHVEKGYLKEKGERRRAWSKNLFPDGSYKINLVEWNCNTQRFRILDVTNYEPSGKVIGEENGTGWIMIVPDSISEKLFEKICANYQPGRPPATEPTAGGTNRTPKRGEKPKAGKKKSNKRSHNN